MKLTVATRVIGGFVIISGLLILISVFSLGNLSIIDEEVEEVNRVAIPVLSSSSALKASFLNMGRITFEAYIEDELDGLNQKRTAFNQSRSNFDAELNKLRQVVQNDPQLSSKLTLIDDSYQEYTNNVDRMLANRDQFLSLRGAIANKLDDVEANADDASTLILDFADMDEVADDPDIKAALEIGSELENRLLSLLTISGEYVKTQTILRAQTVGNEVKIIVDQVIDRKNSMIDRANGADTTGTMDEIVELIDVATNAVTANDGLLQLHLDRLKERNDSETALRASDENSKQGIIELEALLGLADEKVDDVEQSVRGAVSSGTVTSITVVIISLLVAGVIGFFTVVAITRPLARVNELLNVASSGDLTHKLDESAQDEFGLLSKNCNKLINNLKTLIRGINERAEQLAAASEQTSAVTTQTTASIQNQKSQISQVATATTEMHSTSQIVTQSAEDTLAQIQNADDEAQKVRNISLETKETIEVMAKDAQEAADVISKLHQDSASIGGILDVIRGVADQTNLLALNAAIEAARAGEHGRGFAVVADEVRTLASRTQESTQEINSMIEVLQAGAEKAVAVINQGKEQTERCVEQTDKSTLAVDTITDAVKRAHDVSSQIEQSAREQNVVSQEISEKLETIVGIAEETSIGAQQTSESSHEVAKLAEELQLSIRQFKV
jgi:methyl-accepting chemotaxis protein